MKLAPEDHATLWAAWDAHAPEAAQVARDGGIVRGETWAAVEFPPMVEERIVGSRQRGRTNPTEFHWRVPPRATRRRLAVPLVGPAPDFFDFVVAHHRDDETPVLEQVTMTGWDVAAVPAISRPVSVDALPMWEYAFDLLGLPRPSSDPTALAALLRRRGLPRVVVEPAPAPVRTPYDGRIDLPYTRGDRGPLYNINVAGAPIVGRNPVLTLSWAGTTRCGFPIDSAEAEKYAAVALPPNGYGEWIDVVRGRKGIISVNNYSGLGAVQGIGRLARPVAM